MTAILFALLSYFGFAAADIFGTLSSRKINTYANTFWIYVAQQIVLTFFIPFSFASLSKVTLSVVLLTLLLGLIEMLGSMSFYEAVKKGNASVVGTVAASYVIVVVVFSLLFLHEKIDVVQLITIAIIFIGVVVSSLNVTAIKNGKVLDRNIVFALIALLFWGIYFTFIKIPVSKIGYFWPIYLSNFPMLLLFAFMQFKQITFSPKKLLSKTGMFVGLAAVTAAIGIVSYYVAIDKGYTAIVAPISGSYPTLFVLLSFLFLKDKITKQQIAGIIITLIGIVGLSFFSI